MIKRFLALLGTGGRAFVALIGIAGISLAVADYAVTQGSGTNFGSIVVSSVHYAQQLICDSVTPANCAKVQAGNAAAVADKAVTVTDPNVLAAVQAAIPSQSPTVPVGGVGICDSANGTTNPCTTAVTVKAASTPAVATDKAIVVDQRPGTATIAGSAPGTQTAPSSNYVAVNSGDPCFGAAKTTAAFSTSSAGPVSIVALSGSTKVYICSITAINDTAIKLSFIDGTGGSCASAQHAIWGSTTAASGMSLAATGGFTSGNGGGTVGVTAAASAFCLLQSGTSLVAGSITYVQQ